MSQVWDLKKASSDLRSSPCGHSSLCVQYFRAVLSLPSPFPLYLGIGVKVWTVNSCFTSLTTVLRLWCVCSQNFLLRLFLTLPGERVECCLPVHSSVVTCWPGIQSLSNVSFSCLCFTFKSDVARLQCGKVISLPAATAVPPLPCYSTDPFFSWCASKFP